MPTLLVDSRYIFALHHDFSGCKVGGNRSFRVVRSTCFAFYLLFDLLAIFSWVLHCTKPALNICISISALAIATCPMEILYTPQSQGHLSLFQLSWGDRSWD